MSYEKQNFEDGQVLEAEHLNHIEEGLKELEESGRMVIIDRASLPTNNVSENVFYRIAFGELVFNQTVRSEYTCHCVEELPEIGEPMTNADKTAYVVYYNGSDGQVYHYYDETLANQQGIPVGWYDISMRMGSLWAGVITSIDKDPNDNKMRLLLSFKIYHYKDGRWTSLDAVSIGSAGSAMGAEVFNYSGNTASGMYAHAEGAQTTARDAYAHAEGRGSEAAGEASHAEGEFTEAVGDYSHAEGFQTDATGVGSHAEGEGTAAGGGYAHSEGSYTQAQGFASHSEGENTQAQGVGSHSEGGYTAAHGDYSHTEGYRTVARGANQHVHGSDNIEDTEIDEATGRGKYITIVGNGIGNTKSNAHTLDWEGNAWYAGSVEGSKMVLRSPNGTKFDVTVDNNGNLNRGGSGSSSSGDCAWADITGKPFDANGCIKEECIPDTIARLSDISGGGSSGGGGVSSWNDLTDKPFDDGELLFDFIMENATETILDSNGDVAWAKFSDIPPAYEELYGRVFTAYNQNGDVVATEKIRSRTTWPDRDGVYGVDLEILRGDTGDTLCGVWVVEADTLTVGSRTFSKGVWAFLDDDDGSGTPIIRATIAEENKSIDPKYMPPCDWAENNALFGTHIKNRTHYVKSYREYTFDGNVSSSDELVADALYRVADGEVARALTNDALRAATITITQVMGEGAETMQSPVSEVLPSCDFADDYAMIVQHVVVVREDNTSVMGIEFAQAGVYFLCIVQESSTVYVSGLACPEEIVTLPEMYIPDTIARTADFVTEEWVFTLADGSTVTKKVVTAV